LFHFNFVFKPKDWPSLAEATVESSIVTNEQTVSNDNGAVTSQPNTPRTRKKKGKQKWLPLPLEQQELNGDDETSTVPNTNAQNGANHSTSTKTAATTSSSKGNRGSRSARGGRGASRPRTRSLDGTAPKRSRKNRGATAAATAAAYQQAYDAYQDYYAYYCM
jgi:hypothetical protein